MEMHLHTPIVVGVWNHEVKEKDILNLLVNKNKDKLKSPILKATSFRLFFFLLWKSHPLP